jgi:hypothetical protein
MDPRTAEELGIAALLAAAITWPIRNELVQAKVAYNYAF